MKALIIEDDSEIVESISQVLHMRWPAAQLASTHLGKHGMELAERDSYNVIILDLGLPDMSGLEVLKQIRSFSSVPIIVLSVMSEESDIVKGLEWGADDYVVKPCGHLEFLARVNARVRGEDSVAEETLTCGTLCFNSLSRRLIHGKKQINLTALESRIIHHLIRNAGQVSTCSRIVEDVWGDDYPASVDSLRVHIRRLRKKIEADPNRPQLILTKTGVGYLLKEPNSIEPG